jgi:hypothetical protein
MSVERIDKHTWLVHLSSGRQVALRYMGIEKIEEGIAMDLSCHFIGDLPPSAAEQLEAAQLCDLLASKITKKLGIEEPAPGISSPLIYKRSGAQN